MVKLKSVILPDQTVVPALGQGTWFMGESPDNAAQEIAALRCGIEHGLTLIDTAEMYANGAAEIIVGKASQGLRDQLFIVSKVLPYHASVKGSISACEKSLKRLQMDYIDLYLLHWPGSIPIEQTIEAMQRLIEQGKIKRWGVSNFNVSDLKEIEPYVDNHQLTTNQILYNLSRRGIEFDLLPWCRNKKLPSMAYSPMEQGRILKNERLVALAKQYNVTPAQIALAWVLRNDDIIAIPKASRVEHVLDNIDSLQIKLTDSDLTRLDNAFPPPKHAMPLAVL